MEHPNKTVLSAKERKRIQNKRDYLRRRNGQSNMVKSLNSLISNITENLFPARIRRKLGKGIGKIDSADKVILLLLIAALTEFSIRETVMFLSEVESDTSGIWLKAILCDGVILAFSWLTFEHVSLKALKLFTLIGLCCYSLFATSGKVLFSSSQELKNTNFISETVFDLEKIIQKKEAIRDAYEKTSRYSAMRQAEFQIDKLRLHLAAWKEKQVNVKAPLLVQTTTWGLIFFRVLALLANVLCTHKLAELFRKENSATFRKIQPRLSLVKR
jgi:hypothetical protein